MSELVAISDLHLGDRDEGNGSVLSSLSVCKNFVGQLAEITSGVIDTLVFNGDLFEACVPTRTAEENFLHKTGDYLDLYNSTIEDSQKFFAALSSVIKVRDVVWVPGNHDFSLYLKLLADYPPVRMPTATSGVKSPFCGYALNIDRVSKLFGKNFSSISAAYPNFVYKLPKQEWPVAVFTHGHLFDEQVLTPSKEFLSAIGLFAETGKVFPAIPEELDVNPGQWMQKLVDLTSKRVSSIWTQNLDLIKEEVYNYAERRKIHIVCEERPQVQGKHVWLAAMKGINFNSGSNTHLKWYLDGFMQDWSPVLPPKPWPPSFFVKGHTHCGGAGTILSLDNTLFQVYDLGGWTLDAVGHKDNVPHTHALVWEKFPDTPYMYAFNVGKP